MMTDELVEEVNVKIVSDITLNNLEHGGKETDYRKKLFQIGAKMLIATHKQKCLVSAQTLLQHFGSEGD